MGYGLNRNDGYAIERKKVRKTALKALGLAIILASSPSAPSSSGIDVSIWKWVIIIGVAAVVLFYAIWRISQIVVNRKTNSIIRDVVGDSANKDDE
ncbi:MAG: hypothetical protein GY762_04245 [Proteobacteria bacterium]|nr:hypothetical protein [Pseudomonadota bacterium]